MGPLDALLRLVLLPGAVCAGAALVGALLARRAPRARDALLALAAAVGFAAAMAVCGVRPGLPLAVSDSTWQWVVWLACAGALAGSMGAFVRVPVGAAPVLRVLLGAAGAWLVLRPLVPHAVPPGAAVARVAVAGAVATLLWTATRRATREGRGAAAVGAWLVALAGAAVVLFQFGSAAVMAAAAVALASGVAASAACASRGRGPLLPTTIAPVLSLAFVGLLVAAHATLNHGSRVRVPPETVALLAGAAACAGLRRWPIALGLALLCAGAATWTAYVRVGAWLPPVR